MGGGSTRDEIKVRVQAALGVPQVAIDRLPAGTRHLSPALGVGGLAELLCESREIELVAVEQTVQVHGRVVMRRASECAEVEVDVETRFTHRPIAVVVIGGQSIASDPGGRADLR